VIEGSGSSAACATRATTAAAASATAAAAATPAAAGLKGDGELEIITGLDHSSPEAAPAGAGLGRGRAVRGCATATAAPSTAAAATGDDRDFAGIDVFKRVHALGIGHVGLKGSRLRSRCSAPAAATAPAAEGRHFHRALIEHDRNI
jgi:hypothetical protein